MKLLLDTCAFIWIIKGSDKLSDVAKKLFMQAENEIYLSSISIWEMSVKAQLGKLPLPDPVVPFIIEQRELHRIEPLPLHEEAILQLSHLPNYHKDSFDRMLICQAIAHHLTLLTPDSSIQQYPVTTIW